LGATHRTVWRVCVSSPSPTHCGVRIGASGDLPMRRNRPFHERGPLPCVPVLATCSHWRAIGSFRLFGRLGWMIGPVSWWSRRLAARSVCAVGAFLYGGCRVGRARSALGRAERVSRRGRSPQEAVLDGYPQAEVVHSGKFQFLLISVSWAIFCTVIKGLEGGIPRKRAVRA
jgi:hypothetical protein